MLINVLFDDECESVDILSVPNNIGQDIEEMQNQFWKWLFDKNNNHKYWVCENGIKKYCSYGTTAFVEWLNNYIDNESNEKAVLLQENVIDYDKSNVTIYF